MKNRTGLGALLLMLALPTVSLAGLGDRFQLRCLNRHLHGQVIDYTNNHGVDRRIWSPALQECRDLYVYLPPGYDPCQRYPLALWLHGFAQDEQSFLEQVVRAFDHMIAAGHLPPLIVAAPDGSIKSRPALFNTGSFFINSKAGDFEDYLIQDVWGFMIQHYPIRPEREAHILAGASMGGFGAFNLAFKHQDMFAIVVGILPPVNLRWLDCHCRYRRNFDPCCWAWRNDLRRKEVVARFFGFIPIRLKLLTDPLFDPGPEAIDKIARENPIEMLDAYGVCDSRLAMYIGYGGRDQFNIDAQVESFLYVARQRGLCVAVGYEPRGRHDFPTGKALFPGVVKWLAPRLAPYSPTWPCGPNPVDCPVPEPPTRE